ncbi:hypothetical protein O2U01_09165 [Ligilactobacillus salivarius]|uniref:Uncharacterized protein n=1 Tax=Ligilactobacillus salivarius TaxID=1624 RepID=A0ABD7YT40_9LACO|nr:hypothetical protein [Ligilactobacillus salivarius]WHS10376.1 hypothetical protein O2U04_02125 [Ligilactobacillus salivarius]WHS14312.1 hypothetical protein O2U03_01345 [Ligilactobacillus salivarius]WHS17073.1 hypothetical protein O2U02_06095 [Ligilactobacillus salivarius]WHS20270.1 hypothetical protein O2U01_09165 [Ligilactobacillus salivarius]WHS22430.1 hypothetical protein O2U08_09170 [Ligilactobacillus salivarius]
MEHLNLDDIGLTDRTQYNTTVANFNEIQRTFNNNTDEIKNELDSKSNLNDFNNEIKRLDDKTDALDKDWKARLKRVTLGTDEETIEDVVTKILIEKGVI